MDLSLQWKRSDPPERRISHNRPSFEDQTSALVEIYKTPEIDGKYADEPGMEKLGELRLDFPEPHLGFNRKLKFTLNFGQIEIKASCINQNGKSVDTKFNLEL
ncbi:hypothetical protein Glove_83g105 [Diversispora epigaea]|uniref:Uncharacterized protein n=1 Tax=Diversispora epigaea TaxID=1348612 RepID=A0A397H9R3_9GLOM|nr:hypothetical protein Glove_372g105 [Diversispora epigaea]RHZ84324.1 hypothetical protein Glove_83g105 [Diversispora epigaea]